MNNHLERRDVMPILGLTIVMVVGSALSGCSQSTTPEQPISTPTIAQPPDTPTATRLFQLTYLSGPNSQTGLYRLRGLSVGCLSETSPCIGDVGVVSDVEASSARWSPDGSDLVFLSNGVDEWPDVFVRDGETGKTANVTASSSPELDPFWFPDSRTVGFTVCESGNCRLASISVDPNSSWAIPEIRNDLSGPRTATWSADGLHMAFLAYATDNPYEQVFVWSATDRQIRQITSEPTSHLSPSFSQDGFRLAFVRDLDPNSLAASEVVVFDLRNEEVVTVATPGVEKQFDLAWAPTSDWVAFSGGVASRNTDIYMVRVGSGDLVQLTDTPLSDDKSPDWRVIQK